MIKNMSSLTRFILVALIGVLAMTVICFALSSYYFNEVNTVGYYYVLSSGVWAAGGFLHKYQEGAMDQAALHEALNPELNAEGLFYMVLDEKQQVLGYTEGGERYLTSDVLSRLLTELDQGARTVARSLVDNDSILIMGARTGGGYVLAGRPTHVITSVANAYRTRLLISLAVLVALFLLVGLIMTRRVSKPARIIAETAARMGRGEQVELPDDLPGAEMRETAAALNAMSRSVARAINELKYEKETMALILEGLSEGSIAVDAKGDVLHENAAAHRLLGDGDTPAHRAVLAALRAPREDSRWDEKFTAGDRVLAFSVSRLPHDDGVDRGRVALISDITEQERLERTRYDYVANISHELRTPLASIRGLAEGLRDDLAVRDQDRQRYYNIIVAEANRLSRLVDDLLELSSLQSNPAAFDMERVDPNELVLELHDRNGSLFTQKQIEFTRALPEEPLPSILSNEDRLAQALTIFLDNARKYTPAGGLVTLGAEAAEEGIRFFVRDNGIGMDEETQRLAFERFHQAERSHSGLGSGLGLSIAREILQKLGVSIQLASAPGQGSDFSFIIPRADG